MIRLQTHCEGKHIDLSAVCMRASVRVEVLDRTIAALNKYDALNDIRLDQSHDWPGITATKGRNYLLLDQSCYTQRNAGLRSRTVTSSIRCKSQLWQGGKRQYSLLYRSRRVTGINFCGGH